MNSIEINACAKVNLFLKVLNRRPDGYHNLVTVFERIDLADRLTIRKIARGIEVASDRFITRRQAHNLVYKAAELILKRKGIKNGVRIEIEKRIPIASGLGGGSSDAASALVGINRLYGPVLSKRELIDIGSRLGADVPFFIVGAPFAIGTGRGDKLKKVNTRMRLWHLLIFPGFKVETRSIYEAFDASASLGIGPERRRRADLTLTRPRGDAKMCVPFRELEDFGSLQHMLFNDLQDTVLGKSAGFARCIGCLASLLDKKFIVSGSGPSFFCLYRTRKEAEAAKERLLDKVPAAKRKGWQVFVSETLS